MPAGLQGAGFWLPSDFLTDDDFLTDKQNLDNSDNNELYSGFCFPSEFPYHFETHPDHLLQKSCLMSTSPQSTLSMTMTSQYDAVGDLIRLAAGEVAKIKINRGYAVNFSYPQPRNLPQFRHAAKIPTPSVYQNAKFENVDGRSVRRVGEVAWRPHQILTPGRAVSGGAAARKCYAGTGVFLPRRYQNQNGSHGNDYPSGYSASPFQGRAKAQTHTKPYSFEEPQPLWPRIGKATISNLNSMLAGRHAAVLQRLPSRVTLLPEGSSTIGSDHRCLPREWTY